MTLDVLARKFEAGELGKETEAPIADWIDIGVLAANNEPLFLEKRRIERQQTTISVDVAGEPARAGIDPYNELIGRRPKDNTMSISLE